MGRSGNTYLDFAENDYRFFRCTYDAGYKMGTLASIGQNICERYLKHIISEYTDPEDDVEQARKERALRTHNLLVLIKYIKDEMGISIPAVIEDDLARINGYYFSTRYPGDDSFIASESDVDKVNDAVESTREYVMELCKALT